MTDSDKFLIEAPFLVALLAKLFKYVDVPRGGGDPTFLTAVQTEALAAEGVRLLARYLPAGGRSTSRIRCRAYRPSAS